MGIGNKDEAFKFYIIVHCVTFNNEGIYTYFSLILNNWKLSCVRTMYQYRRHIKQLLGGGSDLVIYCYKKIPKLGIL